MEWEAQLLKGAEYGHVPSVKAAWSIHWDNMLAVNHEQHSSRVTSPGVAVVYAKARSPHFHGHLKQILKTDPNRSTVVNVRDMLWALMEEHSCVETQGLRHSPAEAQQIDGLPDQIACADFELVWKPHGGFKFSIWQPKGPPGTLRDH